MLGIGVGLTLILVGCEQLEFTPDDRSDRTPEGTDLGDPLEDMVIDGGEADGILMGAAGGQYVGDHVGLAGDVNGDGYEDLLVTTWDTPGNATALVLGPIEGEVSIADAQAHLSSEDSGAYVGWAYAALDDQDGDGLDDFAVGVPGFGLADPTSFVQVFLSMPEGNLAIEDAGFALTEGEPDSGAGTSLAAPGDVDGDGEDDLVVGALRLGDGGGVHVWPGPVIEAGSLADAAAVIYGVVEGCAAGWSVDGAGDVNDDGIADVVVGSSCDEGVAARAHLVMGPLSGDVDLTVTEASFVAPGSDRITALVLAGGEDLDGDGHEDLVLATELFGHVGDDTEGAFVVRGPFSGAIDLADADAWIAPDEPTSVSFDRVSLALVRDLDGDGRAEIALGTPRDSYEGGGGIVRLFDGDVEGAVSFDEASATLLDQEYSYVGHSVVEADGTHLLVGAPTRSLTYFQGGAVYAVRLDSLER